MLIKVIIKNNINETLKVISGKQYNHTVMLYPPVKVPLCKNTSVLYNKYRFVYTSRMYFNLTLSLKWTFTLCVKKKYILLFHTNVKFKCLDVIQQNEKLYSKLSLHFEKKFPFIFFMSKRTNFVFFSNCPYCSHYQQKH